MPVSTLISYANVLLTATLLGLVRRKECREWEAIRIAALLCVSMSQPLILNVLSGSAAGHTELCACDAWLSSIPPPECNTGQRL